MKLNHNKSAISNIVDLINYSKGTNITVNDIEVSLPTVISTGDTQGDINTKPLNPNTKITIQAKTSSEYTGKFEFHYRRMSLVKQWSALGYGTQVDYGGALDATQIGAFIKSKIKLVPGEVVISINASNSNTALVTITPKGDSLLYTDTLQFTITLQESSTETSEGEGTDEGNTEGNNQDGNNQNDNTDGSQGNGDNGTQGGSNGDGSSSSSSGSTETTTDNRPEISELVTEEQRNPSGFEYTIRNS